MLGSKYSQFKIIKGKECSSCGSATSATLRERSRQATIRAIVTTA